MGMVLRFVLSIFIGHKLPRVRRQERERERR